MNDKILNNMNKIEESILKRSTELMKDIRNYILSNENWIYYFLNPLSSSDANKAIEDIIKEFPFDWEDYIDVQINDFNGSSVKIAIRIDTGDEMPLSLNRFIYIPNFSDTIERNKKLMDGKINDIKIASLKEEIESYKNILSEKEAELEKLLTDEVSH